MHTFQGLQQIPVLFPFAEQRELARYRSRLAQKLDVTPRLRDGTLDAWWWFKQAKAAAEEAVRLG